MTIKRTKGFVLLYAILVAGVVLAVGLVLGNIITKQIVLSSISKDSQISYYLADAARDCARYLYHQNAFGVVQQRDDGTYDYISPVGNIPDYSCNGQPLVQNDSLQIPSYFGYGNFDFQHKFTIGGLTNRCANVIVSQRKNVSPRLVIFASGYNTACNSTSPRKVERIVVTDQ